MSHYEHCEQRHHHLIALLQVNVKDDIDILDIIQFSEIIADPDRYHRLRPWTPAYQHVSVEVKLETGGSSWKRVDLKECDPEMWRVILEEEIRELWVQKY
jgi:hypothetical protein